MKLWTSHYNLSNGYPGGSLIGTCGNKTQIEMGLKSKWDSIDVLGLSTMIYLCTLSTSGTDVDNQY